jgi:hypothetical protein
VRRLAAILAGVLVPAGPVLAAPFDSDNGVFYLGAVLGSAGAAALSPIIWPAVRLEDALKLWGALTATILFVSFGVALSLWFASPSRLDGALAALMLVGTYTAGYIWGLRTRPLPAWPAACAAALIAARIVLALPS